MYMYSKAEKVEMILIYGEAGRNSMHAQRLYAERHPDRQCPSRRSFDRLVKSFTESGSVVLSKRNRSHPKTSEDAEISVLAAVHANPSVSCRQIARESALSLSSVWRILNRNKFHPYHVSLHQALDDNDFQKRRSFCEWALDQIQNNEHFFENMLFTDEATFTNHGQLNKHNMHYWSIDNPRWLRQVQNQRPWSVNVWCGIINNLIIGPFFIDGTLNGQKYSDFLTNALPTLMEDVPLQCRTRMWFQHDGCPAHNALVARNVLNDMLPDRWIGRGARIRWPARSPDLTPLDFFLWGHLKNEVFIRTPTTPEEMRERILRSCNVISPEVLNDVKKSFIYRLRKCIEVNGAHFEHLLK